MAPNVVAIITSASDPYPCRRIQKVRRTLLRTSGRVYRTLAFDVLHHGKVKSQVLRELSNFCCLPGRAGGSPNGLERPCDGESVNPAAFAGKAGASTSHIGTSPYQTRRTFFDSRLEELVSTDFFVVATVNFLTPFVFVVSPPHRHRVIHFSVATNSTSEWTPQQFAEVLPWDTAPRYLLHDRDYIYGGPFRHRVRGSGVRKVLTVPRSAWQSVHADMDATFYGSSRAK
jgi:hypothetical protein